MGLTAGNDVLLFFYDQRGKVSAVDFNGTYYYYLRNGQGDVIKLIDNSKNTVVEYTYDTWGKQLSCTGSLASTLGVLNPFRYRGYVYDEETQWYYLQSRYYDPTTGRFLSADVMLSTGQGVLGHNTYAYCLNNPVNHMDPSGMCSFFLGIKFKDCGDPSCPSSRNYGASPDFIPCTDRNTYCYGYVLRYVYARVGQDPDASQMNYRIRPQYDYFTHEDIPYNLDYVIKHLVFSINQIDPQAAVSVEDDIANANNKDLIIAARVKGIRLGFDDYHFAVRLQDGTWADKRGEKTAFVGRIISGDKGWGRYFSTTKYIIISFPER